MKHDRDEYLYILKQKPVRIANLAGFTLLGDLHNEWLKQMLYGRDDMTLLAHRLSYKTTTVSVALAILMAFRPRASVLFLRKTDTDVKEIIAQVKKIMLNEEFQCVVRQVMGAPAELIRASATELNTSLNDSPRGTGQLLGMGIGSSLTGKHFDYIFTDDIVNLEDRISKAERERTKITYQELQNIRNPGGRIINTGTPWHPDDAISTLMPNVQKWDCHSTGIMTDALIDAKRQSMAPSLFAANYELRHIPSDDVIFPNPQTGADIALVQQGTAHVDAAYYGEDYTAFTVAKVHDGKFYVFGKCWRRHVDDVQPQIVQMYQDLMAGKLYCERNGDKGYLAKQLRAQGVRTVSYDEKQNKYIKITSLLKGVWRDVVFVRGTDEAYIRQITDFNENAEHDDCPDSLASLIRVIGRRSENNDDLFLM